MGLSNKECSRSVLAGLLIIAVAGIMLGSLAGWTFTDYLSMQLTDAVSYDTIYSITMVYSAESSVGENIARSFASVLFTIGFLGAATLLISGLHMKKILKDEPLIMLGKLEE